MWITGRASVAGWATVGLVVVVAVWSALTPFAPDLPNPGEALASLVDLLTRPFYDAGPNDKGIGLLLILSLQRVFLGFALATAVGVPLGFLIGGCRRVAKAANPVVQILRPVSPLAWFPIGLVVFKNSPQAAVFVIFITALWPTVLNTAAGAASVPRDHRNVARVFQFNRMAYIRHVMVPHTLPSIVTGLRLSMGIAWMVIVAAEMLASGATGVGSFVWESYNSSDLPAVTAAIILIGLVGVGLDGLFQRIGRKVALEEVPA
ncbi:MAG: nitrate ABC transporter permease [Acidimicrobiales bacterium]